jgi:hypothetical protein
MKKNNNGKIYYDGGLSELYNLSDDGKINNDKLLEWLATSKKLTMDDITSKYVKKKLRVNKINKINKKA